MEVSMRVLVADDEPNLLVVHQRLSGDGDHRIGWCPDGLVAKTLLAEEVLRCSPAGYKDARAWMAYPCYPGSKKPAFHCRS
jgi:hypothetical protein